MVLLFVCLKKACDNGAVVVLECEKQLILRTTETSQNMSAGVVCDGIIMFIMSSTFSQKGRKFPNMKGLRSFPCALFQATFTETFRSSVTHKGFLTAQLQLSLSSLL